MAHPAIGNDATPVAITGSPGILTCGFPDIPSDVVISATGISRLSLHMQDEANIVMKVKKCYKSFSRFSWTEDP